MINFTDSHNCDLYDLSNNLIKSDFTGKPEYLPEERRNGAPIWTYPYTHKRMDGFGARKETLGQRLVRWCIENNCTKGSGDKLYVDVARLHGYINAYAARWGYSFAYHTIQCYLHQKFSPKIDRATMIANALNVPVAWLMGYGPNDIPQVNNPQARALISARRAEIRAMRVQSVERANVAKKTKKAVIAA